VAAIFHLLSSMWSEAHIRGRWWLSFFLALVLSVLPTGGATSPDGSETIQFGLASWYGPGFHGGETASGEIFDQRQMVAAHRTLPFGAVIRVTNLENGRDVTLRVIDRGPYGRNYRKGTVIDVSRGAAGRLGFIRKGIVRVRIDVIRFPD
jgi:rare lipoprotein A (peptidoglycan hydrolase)